MRALLTLVVLMSGVLALPATANTAPTVGLPSDIDYASSLVSQLQNASFSTDARVAGHRTGNQPGEIDLSDQDGVQVFIINYDGCLVQGDSPTYRVVVRNVADESAQGVSLAVNWPSNIMTPVFTNPTADSQDENQANWGVGTLAPGESNEYSLSLQISAEEGTPLEATVSATVFYNAQQRSVTSHTLGECDTSSDGQNASNESTPRPSKEPAIICHPADETCQTNVPELGARFQGASRPIICSEHDPEACQPTKPQLGVRFAEAIADIEPGECSVTEDAIVSSPEFHDAFIRRTKAASYYLQPLWESGRDFSELVHKNELIGLEHFGEVRSELQTIQTKHWIRRAERLQRVLDGTASADAVLGEIGQWHSDWVSETQQAQGTFRQQYQDLQNERRSHFEPIGNQAIENARTSIGRACGTSSDGGLSGQMSNVQQVYETNLSNRQESYSETQGLFINRDDERYLPEHRTQTWQQDIRSALEAFKNGNAVPLGDVLNSLGALDTGSFASAWRIAYNQHKDDDRAADEQVRLTSWEPALDPPKSEATACETDKQFGPAVEVTWCESGNYPEFVIPAARQGTDATPPQPIPGGTSQITAELVSGVSCGRRPGDPWWADDCSCNCNQLIPSSSGTIQFCQSIRQITPLNPGGSGLPGGTTGSEGTGSTGPPPIFFNPLMKFLVGYSAFAQTASPDFFSIPKPSPILPSPSTPIFSPPITPGGGGRRPITRHDIHVSSVEECLAERAKHADPFF